VRQYELVTDALDKQVARGFALDPQVRDRIDLLMTLWDQHQHGRSVLQGRLDLLNLRYVQSRAERLTAIDRYGWVRLGAVRSPTDPVVLTSEGFAVAEDIAGRRGDHRRRRAASRDAVPYWLNEPSNRGVGKVVVEQMGEFGYFLGVQFTAEEIDDATVWLRENEYIKGVGVLGPGLLRPELTGKGFAVVESDGSVNRGEVRDGSSPTFGGSRIGTQNNHFHNIGPATVANAGRDVNSGGNFTLGDGQREQIRGFVALLDAARPGVAEVSAEDGVVIEQVGEDLAAQAGADDPDPGVLRRGLTTVTEVATRTGTAAAALTMVANQVTSLMSSLGLA